MVQRHHERGWPTAHFSNLAISPAGFVPSILCSLAVQARSFRETGFRATGLAMSEHACALCAYSDRPAVGPGVEAILEALSGMV